MIFSRNIFTANVCSMFQEYACLSYWSI